MPSRVLPLVNGEYYHIYNRGVALQPTFRLQRDYERFLFSLFYYRFTNTPFRLARLFQLLKSDREELLEELKRKNDKMVAILAFCLMPNHIHILVQQLKDGGISRFMKLVSDSYTRYFNTKHTRVGPLFQGAFKAVHVTSDEQLIHLSRYIHLNPLVSFVVQEKYFPSYPWSSFKDYLDNISSNGFVETEQVLKQFTSRTKYKKFVMDQAEYGRELEKIKHLVLE